MLTFEFLDVVKNIQKETVVHSSYSHGDDPGKAHDKLVILHKPGIPNLVWNSYVPLC